MELCFRQIPGNSGRYEHSFREWILERYEEEILTAVRKSASQEDVRLLGSEILDIRIQRVSGDMIEFCACVRCGMHLYESEILKEYGVSCRCCISGAGPDFRVLGISTLEAVPAGPVRFLDTLLPLLPRSGYESLADSILRRYSFHPENSSDPVNAEAFALRIGLNVVYDCIDPACRVLGCLYMENGAVTVYGSGPGDVKILPASRGTVYINTGRNLRPDAACSNFTVMHECVHWILHPYAFWLEKQYDPSLASIVCREKKQADTDLPKYRSSVELMERQANAVASCILMRRTRVRTIVESALCRQDLVFDERLNLAIAEIAARCNVSKAAAAIRIRELGYLDSGTGEALLTYEVPPADLTCILERDPRFLAVLRRGNFIYAENRFCLNRKKYLVPSGNGHKLTLYAKTHPEECCLPFREQRSCMLSPSGSFRSVLNGISFSPDDCRVDFNNG